MQRKKDLLQNKHQSVEEELSEGEEEETVVKTVIGYKEVIKDWRYVLFATFAGYGYGYTYLKTKNLAAAALVHMGVDAVWSLILTYH